MIYDTLANANLYRGVLPGIAQAFDYLSKTDFKDVPNGKYELNGSKLFAMVMRYPTRQDCDAVWESHRKYIDVQFIVAGEERFGYVPLNEAPPVTTPYSEEKDVLFYKPGSASLPLRAGQFAVFFPQDIHAPCLTTGEKPSDVVKVVVKVAVE
jgi:YhcH/YjgK/YiaL family protein